MRAANILQPCRKEDGGINTPLPFSPLIHCGDLPLAEPNRKLEGKFVLLMLSLGGQSLRTQSRVGKGACNMGRGGGANRDDPAHCVWTVFQYQTNDKC